MALPCPLPIHKYQMTRYKNLFPYLFGGVILCVPLFGDISCALLTLLVPHISILGSFSHILFGEWFSVSLCLETYCLLPCRGGGRAQVALPHTDETFGYRTLWYSISCMYSEQVTTCDKEQINKTIKDGDIAPWKDFKKEKRKRNQIRPYFEMGRIVKRLHFLRRPFPKISPRIPQDFHKISKRFPQDFPKTSQRFPKISPRFLQDFSKISLRFL